MDIDRICSNARSSVRYGERGRDGEKQMTLLLAAIGTQLAYFADGAILAASVYLVSRGVRNPLKNRKQ